jgi:hypothetical protein
MAYMFSRNTTMSSKYKTINLYKNALNASFINVEKVVGALHSPKGITKNSKLTYLVAHVVFVSSPSEILPW